MTKLWYRQQRGNSDNDNMNLRIVILLRDVEPLLILKMFLNETYTHFIQHFYSINMNFHNKVIYRPYLKVILT